MGAAPVAYHRSVKSPFPFEYIVEQILVVAGMLVFVQIVCTHYRPGASLCHRRLECREIYLIKGTVVDCDIGVVAV